LSKNEEGKLRKTLEKRAEYREVQSPGRKKAREGISRRILRKNIGRKFLERPPHRKRTDFKKKEHKRPAPITTEREKLWGRIEKVKSGPYKEK